MNSELVKCQQQLKEIQVERDELAHKRELTATLSQFALQQVKSEAMQLKEDKQALEAKYDSDVDFFESRCRDNMISRHKLEMDHLQAIAASRIQARESQNQIRVLRSKLLKAQTALEKVELENDKLGEFVLNELPFVRLYQRTRSLGSAYRC